MKLSQEAINELMQTKPQMTEEQLVQFIGQFDSLEDMQEKLAKVNRLADMAGQIHDNISC